MMDPRQTNVSLLSSWASTVVMLADKLEAREASHVKGQAAEVLINKAGNTEDILTTLAAMGAKLDSHASARVGDRLARTLENAPEMSDAAVSGLIGVLPDLGARMDSKDAASLAIRFAKVLNNSHQASAKRLAWLGLGLGDLLHNVPARESRATHLLILSNLVSISNLQLDQNDFIGRSATAVEERDLRREMAALCSLVEPHDLAEILKWPFCVGEAQKLALAELEMKTGRKFGGEVWKFVDQAKDLGIKDLDAPAKRPQIKDALRELEDFLASAKNH